jgi:hypothetical protein
VPFSDVACTVGVGTVAAFAWSWVEEEEEEEELERPEGFPITQPRQAV